ncbi:hypothetical protein RHGRI_017611 [Rhododendron griersonianum]|uniref:Protein kinase domain-containing protein n=1 Tax=Rhododendron griersonianum TaxID=479676 RepID=A0AAV6JYD6_9ERIC|nr:hypothetical protein RHGRI_017611 [Rhododendron griersonianum]
MLEQEEETPKALDLNRTIALMSGFFLKPDAMLMSMCMMVCLSSAASFPFQEFPRIFGKEKARNGKKANREMFQPMGDGSSGGASSGLAGITVGKSVEFSYEELAKATNDFNIANKIGQGGFGASYYAELQGKKAAIKKMAMQASREFLAELKVLTHVHHLNLVHLIGYCVEGSLFLVYEYIENGNLSQHLRGSGKEPLPWSTRVQIALDSARGLEYIHEHTVPVYIHRDIKSANILIDKNFHGKVSDFGLAKLTEVGVSLPTRLVGTFGYMPPECFNRWEMVLNRVKDGLSVGVIAGIAVAGVAGALLLGFSVYIGLYRKKKVQDQVLLSATPEDQSFDTARTPRGTYGNGTGSSGGASSGLAGITVGKSVEFSYEELAKATNDFNIANKIGQRGYGAI